MAKINTVTKGETADTVQVVLGAVELKAEEKRAEEKSVVDVTTSVVSDRKVKIKTKISFKQYIGNEWFYFKAGEITYVPVNVRDILLRQGALEVIA